MSSQLFPGLQASFDTLLPHLLQNSLESVSFLFPTLYQFFPSIFIHMKLSLANLSNSTGLILAPREPAGGILRVRKIFSVFFLTLFALTKRKGRWPRLQ